MVPKFGGGVDDGGTGRGTRPVWTSPSFSNWNQDLRLTLFSLLSCYVQDCVSWFWSLESWCFLVLDLL